MARPTTIRDEDILDAARAVLLEAGWSATSADVAKRAGVSEGTVFNRFKSKDELFHRAIVGTAAPIWLARLPARIGASTFEEQVTEIAHDGIAFFRVLIPFIMLGWSNQPGSFHRDIPVETGPIGGLKRVGAYFAEEMKLGRVATHDPEVVARVFVGALWNFVSMELMFEAQKHLPMPETTYVRSMVRLMFEGLKPSSEPRGGARSPAGRRAKGRR